MNNQGASLHRTIITGVTVTTLALSLVATGGTIAPAKALPSAANWDRQMTADSKFYCNTKALSPAERARHKRLTEKLIAARTDTVESALGYEFQFSPQSTSIPELADWVVAEGKCCPFFDFHIDLEREGSLLCLRLTGVDGVKPFIRSEFHVAEK